MLVKRYNVKDMQQAMDTIVRELGSDAVILSSRKVRQKGFRNWFKKPMLEVMVAYDPDKVPGPRRTGGGGVARLQSARTPAALATPEIESMYAGKLEHLDNRINSLDQMMNNFITRFSYVKRDITYDFSEGVEAIMQAMMSHQVNEELVHALAKEADAILRKRDDLTAKEILEHLALEEMGQPAPISPKKLQQKIVLMIGPTGAGKTTSLVKLAANFTLTQKKKVGIVNTDTYRIAAQEQLKIYTDILDIPLLVAYQTGEIGEAVSSLADRDIIFIDTAGKRPGDEQNKADVSYVVEQFNPEDVMLCISASTSFAAMKEIVDAYSFLESYKLVVTKLDETRCWGMLLNLCWYSKKRLAYVATGQNVPDDIEVVDVEAVAGQLLKPLESS